MGRNRKADRELKKTLDVIKENSKIIAENSQTMVVNTGRTNEKLDSMKSDIDAIKGSSQTVEENTGHANEKLDDMKSDIDAIKGSSEKIEENTERINEKLDDVKNNTASKVGTIIAIIGVLATISGISIADIIADRKNADAASESVFEDESGSKSESEPETESEPEPEYTIYLYPEYSKFNIGFEVDMTASLNFEADSVSITAHLASGGEDTLELNRKNSMEWQKKVEFDEVGVHEIVVSATAPNGEVVENSIEVEVTPISINTDKNIDMDVINQLFSP